MTSFLGETVRIGWIPASAILPLSWAWYGVHSDHLQIKRLLPKSYLPRRLLLVTRLVRTGRNLINVSSLVPTINYLKY